MCQSLKFIAPLLLIAAAGVSACSTPLAYGATDPTFCEVARPITWSTRDTDQTIDELKQHNARGVELCGWTGSKQ